MVGVVFFFFFFRREVCGVREELIFSGHDEHVREHIKIGLPVFFFSSSTNLSRYGVLKNEVLGIQGDIIPGDLFRWLQIYIYKYMKQIYQTKHHRR